MSKLSKSLIVLILIMLALLSVRLINLSPKRGGEENKAVFICPSGEELLVQFNNESNSAIVTLPDNRHISLSQTISASGARYANQDESLIVWNNGDEVFVEEHGVRIYDNCFTEETVSIVRSNEDMVRTVVTDFGERLKNVSLLAPHASSAIATEYTSYVTPELLSEWMNNPSSAPGREVSSPWPDHIKIIEIDPGDIVYVVNAEIVLMTSSEIGTNRNAGIEPIELSLTQRDGRWLINSYRRIHN